ncbi:MAG: hypothetical protein H6550_15960 [Chitinophagales bacterium]|nr:hypothetical protein [Chitinophagales bacterium]
MAQTLYHTYKANDSTDALNRKDLAMLPEGLYKGFDYDSDNSSGTTLTLFHETTGYVDVAVDQTASDPKGAIKTKQGMIVVEDEAIAISITGNAAGNPRIDIIYLEHERVETVGGAAATYGQIAGTAAATPTIPSLTYPNKQVIIGYIYWPASTTDISDASVRYVRNVLSLLHEYMKGTLSSMTYTAGTKELITNVRSNWYYVANIDSNYKEVELITTPNDGFEVIHIFTMQKLRIDTTGAFLVNAPTVGDILIEPGEVVSFIKLAGTIASGVSDYYVLLGGGSVRRANAEKLTGQLIPTKGTATIDLDNGHITLNGDGNFYVVSFDFTALTDGEIKAITTFQNRWDGLATRTKEGAQVILKLVNTGTAGTTITIVDGATPDTSAFATLDTSAINPNVTDGAYFSIIEEASAWTLFRMYAGGWVDGNDYTANTDTGAFTIGTGDIKYNRYLLEGSNKFTWVCNLEGVNVTGTPGAVVIELPTAIQDLGLGFPAPGLVQVCGMYDSPSAAAAVYATLGKAAAGATDQSLMTLRKLDGTSFGNGTDQYLSFTIVTELVAV